jgi:hypothetical protein
MLLQSTNAGAKTIENSQTGMIRQLQQVSKKSTEYGIIVSERFSTDADVVIECVINLKLSSK